MVSTTDKLTRWTLRLTVFISLLHQGGAKTSLVSKKSRSVYAVFFPHSIFETND